MRYDQETNWVIPETPEEEKAIASLIGLLIGEVDFNPDAGGNGIQHCGDGEFLTYVHDCGKAGGIQSYRLELRRGRKMPIIPVEGLD